MEPRSGSEREGQLSLPSSGPQFVVRPPGETEVALLVAELGELPQTPGGVRQLGLRQVEALRLILLTAPAEREQIRAGLVQVFIPLFRKVLGTIDRLGQDELKDQEGLVSQLAAEAELLLAELERVSQAITELHPAERAFLAKNERVLRHLLQWLTGTVASYHQDLRRMVALGRDMAVQSLGSTYVLPSRGEAGTIAPDLSDPGDDHRDIQALSADHEATIE